MTSLVERLKHRRRNPTYKLLEEAVEGMTRLEIMVDRRNRMIREMLNNIVLPGDIERRAERLIEDEEI